VPRNGDLLENVTGANLFYAATATFWDGSRGVSRGSSAIYAVRKKGRVLLKICGDCSQAAGLPIPATVTTKRVCGQIEETQSSTSSMLYK
jgi:hypothetical protein